VAISSWVGVFPFIPLPFEDHPSMSDRPEKQPQEKQTREPLVTIIDVEIEWW